MQCESAAVRPNLLDARDFVPSARARGRCERPAVSRQKGDVPSDRSLLTGIPATGRWANHRVHFIPAGELVPIIIFFVDSGRTWRCTEGAYSPVRRPAGGGGGGKTVHACSPNAGSRGRAVYCAWPLANETRGGFGGRGPVSGRRLAHSRRVLCAFGTFSRIPFSAVSEFVIAVWTILSSYSFWSLESPGRAQTHACGCALTNLSSASAPGRAGSRDRDPRTACAPSHRCTEAFERSHRRSRRSPPRRCRRAVASALHRPP